MGGRGVRHEHKIDKLGDERDWRKIRNRIVAERTVETGVHREGCCGKQDRVSIRIGSCGVFVANVDAGASLVLNKNLLVPHLGKLVCEHACDNIRRAAGSDRHNYAHGLIWKIGFQRLRAPLPNEKVPRECLGGR